MNAYIKGIDALKAADPLVRILTTEPLINIVPGNAASDEAIENAVALHDAQFQVTEILCGRMCPELGGSEDYLDILGYNFYYNNQWTAAPHEYLDWKTGEANPKFVPLHQLLIAAYKKYNRPFVLTETSHPKEDRPLWINMIAIESQKLLEAGLPYWGICWYPMVNRPDWDYLHDWHYAGIWDDVYNKEPPGRVLHVPSSDALLAVQNSLNKLSDKCGKMPGSKFMFATAIENSLSQYFVAGSTKRLDAMPRTDHYNQWEKDFYLVKEMGTEFLRYGPPYYKTHAGPEKYDWCFTDVTFNRF